MYCIKVALFAPTASFRIPESHTFQQTLPLPPITTIKGILGAAAGFSCQEVQDYCDDNEVLVGILGTSQSRYTDLWKYYKIKSKEIISAVLSREFLFQLNFELIYVCKKRKVIDDMKLWFSDPKYAITAGNSDDLAKITSISKVSEVELAEQDMFNNTILPGDHSDNYISNIDISRVPLMQSLFVPQVYLLPSKFTFTGHIRKVSQRRHYTFIDTPITLSTPAPGINIDGRSVALL